MLLIPRSGVVYAEVTESQEGNDVREYEVAAQERADVTKARMTTARPSCDASAASMRASLSRSPATAAWGPEAFDLAAVTGQRDRPTALNNPSSPSAETSDRTPSRHYSATVRPSGTRSPGKRVAKAPTRSSAARF